MYNICNVDGIYEFHRLFPVGGGCNAQLSSINDRLADIENLLWPPAPNSINVGDVVYWTGSERKTISPDRWISTLGTPIGVVTIPDGFAPDGKARMVALSGVTSGGTVSSRDNVMIWSSGSSNSTLSDYTKVPTTDNAGSTTIGSSSSGYLPSDKFTGAVSFVDSVAKYNGSTPMIPSPYKIVDGITYPNLEYYKEISGNNVLSDFSGQANTQTLVGLGTGYTSANVCWKYKDAANSGTQWYLPACGELGYMMPRFNVINSTLLKLNAVQLDSSNYYWSSSESSSSDAYAVHTNNGTVNSMRKRLITGGYYARPWAVVE